MIVQLTLDTQVVEDTAVLSALGKVMNAVSVDFEDVTPEPEAPKAKPRKRTTKKSPPKDKPKKADAKEEVKFDDLRAAFMQYVQKNDTDAGMDALKSVGAARLSQVTEDKYAELMAVVSAS